jgi:hypothetical protein
VWQAFVTQFVRTQMFQRFLEGRVAVKDADWCILNPLMSHLISSYLIFLFLSSHLVSILCCAAVLWHRFAAPVFCSVVSPVVMGYRHGFCRYDMAVLEKRQKQALSMRTLCPLCLCLFVVCLCLPVCG